VSEDPEPGLGRGELDLLDGLNDSDRLLDGLEPEQCAAVTHRGGRLIVSGAAGTGKTRVIETRLLWLVAQGAAPERIVLLVPTAARAAAARERLETALETAYEELHVLTPSELALLVLNRAGTEADPTVAPLSAGDRLAMLVQRIDELSLQHHDFGGRPNALLAGFVRRIDRLKAELVTPEEYARWAGSLPDGSPESELEREFADVYASHEAMLAETGARDAGDLIADALSLARRQPALARRFTHLLIDDAQELDLAPQSLALEVGEPGLTVAGDPGAGLRRFRGAGAARMASFAAPGAEEIVLRGSRR
jgi:DNA helicase-2/ATP-dependent DNA helicase PcrA